jgi:hypothetical protein
MLGMSALEDLCAKKELSKTALLHAMTGAAPWFTNCGLIPWEQIDG